MKRVSMILLLAALAAGLVLAEGQGEGQASWPLKPIQVVVPAGAGGDTDVNIRILGQYMEKELGQPYVVVNVSGAGGSLGTRRVKDAAPDGYTVLFFHPGMLLNKLMDLVDYTFTDMEVGGLAILDETNVFATNARFKYNGMAEVAAALKAKPKSISFATEIGSFTHLQILSFQEAAGVEFNVVDVGGAAAKTAALKGQQIDMIGTQYGLIKDYVTNGDFKVLGVLSDQRNPAFTDVPTFKEQGFDASFTKFFFYAFPKGTPKEIVDTFNAALKRVVENPEFVKEITTKMLVTPTWMNPADTVAFLKGEEAKYMQYKSKIMSSTIEKKQ